MENKLKKIIDIARKHKDLDVNDLLSLAGLTEDEPVDTPSRKDIETIIVPTLKKNKIKNANKRWSTDDDRTLIHLLSLGKTQKQIGITLERTRQSVAARVEKLREKGVKLDTLERRRYSNEEISLIRYLLEKHNRNISSISKNDIEDLAETTKRTPQAIQTRLYKELNLMELEDL